MKLKVSKDMYNKTHVDLNYCHSNDNGKDKCGYCKQKKENTSAYQWGFSSCKMRVDDYQTLMDRGWRRCGEYYYKPDLK